MGQDVRTSTIGVITVKESIKMDDAELNAIRAARLQELQRNAGQSTNQEQSSSQ